DLECVRGVLPRTVGGGDRWEMRAVAGLLENLLYVRRQLTADVLASSESAPPEERVRIYAERSTAQLERARHVIDDLKVARQPTLPGVIVALRELSRLARPGPR